MKAWPLLVVLLTTVAASEILWEFDLDALPSGWSADSLWMFPGEGARLFLYASADSGWDWQSQMWSNQLVIPSGVDSVWMLLSDDHMNWGGVGGGYAWSAMGAEVYVNDIHVLTLWSQYNEWGKGSSPADQPNHPVLKSIPVTEGDMLEFGFHGEAHAEGGAYASIEYIVFELTVSSTDLAALEPSTWAEIKSLLL